MVMGINYHEFWDMNPHIISIFSESYKIKRKTQDEMNWMQGAYFLKALETALDRCFNGKKAKESYFEKPFLQTAEENSKPVTEEDKKRKTEQLFNMLRIMQVNHENSNE